MKIIDITVPVSPGLPVWPGYPRVVLKRYRSISLGNPSNDSKLACSVHSGTHVDAPAHFIENGTMVEQLPLDTLMGPTVVAESLEVDLITPEVLDDLNLASQTSWLLLKTRNSALDSSMRIEQLVKLLNSKLIQSF